jgi:7,8-dihydropterin-6-yl-methyl-4-(beta-D-ribofuranosyl)aminobenzene 5'-phosphate synthase
MVLPEVDRIRVTSVVDNFVDNLLRDEGPAKRRPRQPRRADRCLCAEHGLAECVQSERGGETLPLLFDFGATPLVYLHNLALLLADYQIDLADIRTLVLSHGHWDHYGGLLAFLEQKRRALPDDAHLYAGEDAFLARWNATANSGARQEMGMLDEAAVRAFEIGVVRVTDPRLVGGQALLSGEIARTTSYELPSPNARVVRDGQDLVDDLSGEQALVYHLRGKGLVVLTACGHAGVVNTVRHAREVTGVDKVHAIVGGFHLSGAPHERIAHTVDDLAAIAPDIVVPMHCTGIETIHALRERMPQRVVFNSAGTRYDFAAS